MSEEQPIFKVTDRRLFNSDGTPRDIEREEEPAEPATTPPAPEPVDSASAAPSAPDAGEAKEEKSAERPIEASAEPSADAPDELPDDEGSSLGDESEIPGAHDPTSFINFLMSIASNAASALGMMEHPVTGERRVDVELGKHWIDILGMLREKTRGNLHPQEEQIFDGLLTDLRMQYVSLNKAAPPKSAAGGLTGRDIIGGN